MSQEIMIAVESLLDLEFDDGNVNHQQIKQLYWSWDKGDCSTVGLIRLLMIQECRKHIRENGSYSDDSVKIMLEFCEKWSR